MPRTATSHCYLNRNQVNFVVGGVDTDIFEFPFAALIGYRDPREPSRRAFEGVLYLCGGTLINTR